MALRIDSPVGRDPGWVETVRVVLGAYQKKYEEQREKF